MHHKVTPAVNLNIIEPSHRRGHSLVIPDLQGDIIAGGEEIGVSQGISPCENIVGMSGKRPRIQRIVVIAEHKSSHVGVSRSHRRSHPRLFCLYQVRETESVFALCDDIERVEKPSASHVVDEAYIDFAGVPSYLRQLASRPNLIVLQTFSKAWGMAGIRLGMAFAKPEIIGIMNKVKYPYNINLLTQKRAMEEVMQYGRVQGWVDSILKERTRLMEEIAKLDCTIKVYPSDANFFLARVKDAAATYNYLVDQGIIVRNRSKIALCGNSLRVTVGTAPENNALIDALKKYN